MTTPTEQQNTEALIAEAKRRARASNPQFNEARFDAWYAEALTRGGVLVLTLDGSYCEYPRQDAPQTPPRPSNGQV